MNRMVKFIAIHWLGLDTNRTIFSGHRATIITAMSSTMFFPKVCQFVRWMASPKQPQSVMGLNIASHAVMSVITAMKTSMSFDTWRRLMASSMNMPRENSSPASSTAIAMVT